MRQHSFLIFNTAFELQAIGYKDSETFNLDFSVSKNFNIEGFTFKNADSVTFRPGTDDELLEIQKIYKLDLFSEKFGLSKFKVTDSLEQ